jgi:predicted amidohydrolase YtcJ
MSRVLVLPTSQRMRFGMLGASRMGLTVLLVAGVMCMCSALPARAESQANAADTIVTHAKVYTVNHAQPWAEAVAIKNGMIVAVGKSNEVLKLKGPNTEIIDAQGHLLLPGFGDAHVHFMEGSMTLLGVKLDDAKTIADIQKSVKDYAAAHPGSGWILGMGWHYDAFGATAMPDKEDLDIIVSDRPVFLRCFDGHTSWANSKALQVAGIDRNTPDPENGKIVRDAEGNATGALKESASALVEKVLPKPTREVRLAALRAGLQEARSHGVTRIHSAGGDFEYFDLYNELRKNGQLTARFYISYFLDPPGLTPEILSSIEKARARYHDEWLAAGAVKTMLDGVVESHTAAMLTPYADNPALKGKMFWESAQYQATVTELDKRGFQIFTHAIGDGAVRLALDSYQNMQKTNATNDARPRIEHIETITAEDISRFGQLGVIPSMQPLHAYPDADTLDVWLKNAGTQREPRAFAWQSIAKAGGRLAFGSDWPVVTISPWPGVQTALTRQTTDGQPAGGFVPAQRLTLEQTIEDYTMGVAYAGKRESSEGSIAPGKLADLIIVDQDLFQIDPHKIDQTQVLLTMVGGKVVHQSKNWTTSAIHGRN